jgi:ribulose-phosphate 3-epimerase
MIFMTVEPGFVGQYFKPQALEGIKKIKRVIDDNNYKIELGADGGLSENTIPDVLKSGVKNLILGSSSLFKVKGIYESYKKAVLNVRKIAENCFKE